MGLARASLSFGLPAAAPRGKTARRSVNARAGVTVGMVSCGRTACWCRVCVPFPPTKSGIATSRPHPCGRFRLSYVATLMSTPPVINEPAAQRRCSNGVEVGGALRLVRGSLCGPPGHGSRSHPRDRSRLARRASGASFGRQTLVRAPALETAASPWAERASRASRNGRRVESRNGGVEPSYAPDRHSRVTILIS